MIELYVISLVMLIVLLLYIKRRIKAYQIEKELNRREIATKKKRATVADVYVGDAITKETAERLSAFNNDFRREYKIFGTDKKWTSYDARGLGSPVKPISQETGDKLIGLLESMNRETKKRLMFK